MLIAIVLCDMFPTDNTWLARSSKISGSCGNRLREIILHTRAPSERRISRGAVKQYPNVEAVGSAEKNPTREQAQEPQWLVGSAA
jgi:hypothetical protein